jgi:hypothetical protein
MQRLMGEVLAIDDSQIGKRSEPRTKLSVMASMVADSVTGPVMICNLSTRGGMIEGDRLPAIGERIELRRGDLLACARVIWTQSGKAGLQFVQSIKIPDWLPSSHAGQQAVDNIFQQLKAGVEKAPVTPLRAAPTLAVPKGELLQAAEGLEGLADTLAEDIDVVSRHSTDLQVLDIAAQIMRRLAAAED